MGLSAAEMNTLSEKIMDYECGEMPPLEIIPFFQKLIDCGLAWKLQGGYSEQALNLIEQGYCLRMRQ